MCNNVKDTPLILTKVPSFNQERKDIYRIQNIYILYIIYLYVFRAGVAAA